MKILLLKLKFVYLYMYYEILIYWALLAHFSFMLPLIRQCFFLFLLFSGFFFLFCFSFLFFFKPKFFDQYLFESLRKQQLRDILLNIYVFHLINFTKLYSLLRMWPFSKSSKEQTKTFELHKKNDSLINNTCFWL